MVLSSDSGNLKSLLGNVTWTQMPRAEYAAIQEQSYLHGSLVG